MFLFLWGQLTCEFADFRKAPVSWLIRDGCRFSFHGNIVTHKPNLRYIQSQTKDGEFFLVWLMFAREVLTKCALGEFDLIFITIWLCQTKNICLRNLVIVTELIKALTSSIRFHMPTPFGCYHYTIT